MAMEGLMICAVLQCTAPVGKYSNLCDDHRLPGAILRMGDSTMVITAWYAEHGDESGIILLNDWALGAHFNGAEGFERKLRKQGFVNVRLLLTPTELEEAKVPTSGNNYGSWSGSWCTSYAWEDKAESRTGNGETNNMDDTITMTFDDDADDLGDLVYIDRKAFTKICGIDESHAGG
jgi:hypothetical protein